MNYNNREIFVSIITNIIIICLFIFSIVYIIILGCCEKNIDECDCNTYNICKQKESKVNSTQINEKPEK